MLIYCGSKRCHTTRNHLLKVDTNEAICETCSEVNTTASDFIKMAMKGAGDIYRAIEARKAFSYKCVKCNVDRGTKLLDDKPVCEVCEHPFDLAAPMVEAIKAHMSRSAHEAGTSEVDKGVVKRRKNP